MNMIYLHTHDSGRLMHPYGCDSDTPSLDGLARDGVIFRNAYCACPTCSPSRAAMLTGMTPHNTGMLGLAHRGFSLNDYSKHLGHYLRDNGFYTALIGVQHESGRSEHQEIGYSEFLWDHRGTNEETDEVHTAAAVEFLNRAKSLGQPFFLSFGLRSTHRKYPALTDSEKAASEFIMPPSVVPDTPENRLDFMSYRKSIHIADRCIGKVLRALEDNGLADDTVIMYTTDHGAAYPNMKCSLYDTGIGVALILRHPRMGHACSDALVSHLDVYPTVCDMLGVPRPEWLQGQSFMPLIERLTSVGGATAPEIDRLNDYIFAEVTFHAAFEPMRCVRSERFKLIRYYGIAKEGRRPSNTDDSAPKDLFFSTSYSRESRPAEEFFDLRADPCERVNLIGDSAYAEDYKRLALALDNHMKSTNDPLLTVDEISARSLGNAKTKVNPPDSYSPAEKSVLVFPKTK